MMASQASCQCQVHNIVENAVNTLRYSPLLCVNCGACLDVCPHGVFAPGNGRVQVVKHDACMECGACQLNCPANAISVDSGVGCASAMIYAALTGRKEVTCGGDEPTCCKQHDNSS